MNKINNVAELREAIRDLEHQHYINEQFMRKRIGEIAENLKPVNIVKNVFRQVFTGKEVKTNLLNVATGLATSFIVKRLFRRK